MSDALNGRHVLVGVGGSIAAFKSCLVVTELRNRGAEVRVAMTGGAQRFVTPLTLQSLSGHPVVASLWAGEPVGASPEHGMIHLSLAEWTEIQVVVAAPANLIARLALGFADDAVTATALACSAPLIVAPAMETAMWRHPAVEANVAMLQSRGTRFVGPIGGRLASGIEGEGRMAEAEAIVATIESTLAS